MSKDVNKCIFIGRLVKDPTVKYTPSGAAVANFSIACNESFKGKDGNRAERVEYVNIVLWQRSAEIAGEYLKKGSKVYIEGRLQTRSWDKDGTKHYMTEVVGNELVLLDTKEKSTSEQPQPAAQTVIDDSEIPF